ncbi:MAG: YdcH family protein [Acidobacteriota bacterium]
MEQTTESSKEELKAHLTATDGHFRSLVEEHALYHDQLEQLEAKSKLTLADEEVEHRLKLRKLHLKDEINAILSKFQGQFA